MPTHLPLRDGGTKLQDTLCPGLHTSCSTWFTAQVPGSRSWPRKPSRAPMYTVYAAVQNLSLQLRAQDIGLADVKSDARNRTLKSVTYRFLGTCGTPEFSVCIVTRRYIHAVQCLYCQKKLHGRMHMRTHYTRQTSCTMVDYITAYA